jgi:hypothetical protein
VRALTDAIIEANDKRLIALYGGPQEMGMYPSDFARWLVPRLEPLLARGDALAAALLKAQDALERYDDDWREELDMIRAALAAWQEGH